MCPYMYLKIFKSIYMYLCVFIIIYMYYVYIYNYIYIWFYVHDFQTPSDVFMKKRTWEAYVPQQWSVSRASQALGQELAMIQPHVFDSQTH